MTVRTPKSSQGWWALTNLVLMLTIGLSFSPLSSAGSATAASHSGEILWDSYGIPHIYGNDIATVVRGYGYAQMEAHAEAILKNIAVVRGRTAEYFGPGNGNANVTSDIQVRTFGIPDRAKVWLANGGRRQQDIVNAFVAGLNEYATSHILNIDPLLQQVLPVVPEDILAAIQHQINFTFLLVQSDVPQLMAAWQAGTISAGPLPSTAQLALGKKAPNGSNGWAIGSGDSDDGNAILMGNPHLPWGANQPIPGLDGYQWFEAQLVTPSLNAYGATFISAPFIGIGFNDDLGWTHTNNWIKNADLYELTLTGDGRYVWDGGYLPLQARSDQITVYSSVHGPIVAQKGNKALALKVAGLDSPSLVTQYWDMIKSHNLHQFKAAEKEAQMPIFNVIYADRHGHIMYLDGGEQPVRSGGTYADWAGILPGDTSAALWSKVLPWQELPKAIDPPSGFVQNANDPPWSCTFPQVLDPRDYPSYLAGPVMALRPQHSAQFLLSHPFLTTDDVIAGKESTTMLLAGRLVPDLIAAAQASGEATAESAASVLQTWQAGGYSSDADSQGAALFELWYDLYTGDPNTPKGPSLDFENNVYPAFTQNWSPDDPLNTPYGLAAADGAVSYLVAAATTLQQNFGAMDVAFGDVHRAVLVTHDPTFSEVIPIIDDPVSGSDSVFGGLRIVWPFPEPHGKHMWSYGGDSYVQVVEFTKHGPKAQALLGYGNASRPNSPHITDQMELFDAKSLRPVPRSRPEVEAVTVSREAF
jgi:acyl-homoserine-lactone acylase